MGASWMTVIRALPSHPGWTALVAGRATAEHAGFERDLRARVEAVDWR